MKVTIPDTVMINELGREGVLLDLANGAYFKLDEVGMAMWRAFAQHGDTRDALEQLVGQFDTTAEILRRDIDAFARVLADHKLIDIDH